MADINGTGGPDILNGTPGSDTIKTKAGNDDLSGSTGGDNLYGGANNDILRGNPGNDKLYGQKGDDILYGGAGNDKLYGGQGDDRLTGGIDADTFFFISTDGSDSNDTVTDFEDNIDTVVLRGITVATHEQKSNGVLLTFSNGATALFLNATWDQLQDDIVYQPGVLVA